MRDETVLICLLAVPVIAPLSVAFMLVLLGRLPLSAFKIDISIRLNRRKKKKSAFIVRQLQPWMLKDEFRG